MNHIPSTCEEPRRKRDAGVTFIEILVSVVLLGTAGIAVLTALAAAATGAAVQRDVSDAQASLATAGDALTDTPADLADDDYVQCAVPADYSGALAGLATESVVTIQSIQYWDGAAFGNTCTAATSGERLQRITLAAATNRGSQTLAVVKRPALEPTVDLGPVPPGAAGSDGSAVTVATTPGLGNP